MCIYHLEVPAFLSRLLPLLPGYPARRQEAIHIWFEKALLTSLSIAEGDHNQLPLARGYITNGTH